VLIRAHLDQNAAWGKLPGGDPDFGPYGKEATRLRFRSRHRVMPTEPQPARALKSGQVP
jgi:hypothetical protein